MSLRLSVGVETRKYCDVRTVIQPSGQVLCKIGLQRGDDTILHVTDWLTLTDRCVCKISLESRGVFSCDKVADADTAGDALGFFLTMFLFF